MNPPICIGWAQTDITPQRPVYVIGQLYSRISSYVHDPLTATCLCLDNGEEQITLVSCDIPSAPVAHIPRILERVQAPGLDKSRVVFCATHTHNSTLFSTNTTLETYFRSALGDLCPQPEEPENILKDEELSAFFVEKISALIEDAWTSRAPGSVALAHDYAVVAHCRRPQFQTDRGRVTRMYGACSDPAFVGLEDVSDHSADMLYTWDASGRLTGVAACIPCPAQVYELHEFLSADYWGEARSRIRESLGEIYILPLCGAAGDQNPLDLVRISKDNERQLEVWNAQEQAVWRNLDMLRECQDIGLRIRDAVMRGYARARNERQTRPVLRANLLRMDVALRTVNKADVDAARGRIEAVRARYAPGETMTEAQMIRCFEDIGYLSRWKLQAQGDRFSFPVFVFRLGSAAFATNPFELYVEYALRIKARCKAPQPVVVQLSSNAKGGYLPTRAAIEGGGYGSKPVSTTVGPEGGDELVEKTIAAIDALFE